MGSARERKRDGSLGEAEKQRERERGEKERYGVCVWGGGEEDAEIGE